MSNSVSTQWFFPGCNQDNNFGYNFKNLLGSPEKKISNHKNK